MGWTQAWVQAWAWDGKEVDMDLVSGQDGHGCDTGVYTGMGIMMR